MFTVTFSNVTILRRQMGLLNALKVVYLSRGTYSVQSSVLLNRLSTEILPLHRDSFGGFRLETRIQCPEVVELTDAM